MPLAVVTGSGASAALRWVHGDHMGVPLLTTDATGAVVTPTGYALSGFPGQFANAVLLPGAAHYYNRYRDYDPSTGRYIQADPIGLAGDPNPYAYALGNPLRYTDPTGEFVPILAAAAFGFAAGAGIDLALQALANWASGRSVSDPANYNPTQAAVSGALGGLSGGAGALFFNSARAAGLGGATICNTAKGADTAIKSLDEVIYVANSGVALPSGGKYRIPGSFVQNPHRSGSYGEVVGGKFKERLRIDPPTLPGQKGPNYSHYHRDGKGTHYSPRPGDKDPGFWP